MKMDVVLHVGVPTLVQREPSRVCLFVYLGVLGAIYEIISTYNKRKTSLGCGMAVNIHCIHDHPTSSAGFPLVPK